MITVTPPADSLRVVGYIRVSSEEQKRSGLGLEAQREQLERAAELHGWTLVDVLVDVVSGKGMDDLLEGRPELAKALLLVRSPAAQALVVAKLDRLTRSVLNFAQLLQMAGREGWQLVALDVGVDTSTPVGEVVANVMASMAQLERRLISDRTKEALAAAKARGTHVGRPVAIAPQLEARIVKLAMAGESNLGIARRLTAEGLSAPLGGARWHDTSVARVLARHPEVERLPRGRRPRVPTG